MVAKNIISASAPGSLMLLGEHAVLHGRRALVCAINKRIQVTLEALDAPVLRIGSALGSYEAPLNNLIDHPDFRFVLDAVRQYPLEQGIELKIESEFSSDIGFGSSAAVTVATHAALMNFPRSRTSATGNCRAGAETPPLNKMDLFKQSLSTVHRVQGRGSGADVAASVFGGVIAYRADPLEIQTCGVSPIISSFQANDEIIGLTPEPLTAVYSGSKMKTVDVIRHLEERRALNPEYYEKIFDRMDASVGEVIESDKVERDLRARSERARSSHSTFLECLGREMIMNQKLMEEMGLCNAALAEIIAEFKRQGVPAKISGSGLGDCAIGLGSAAPTGLQESSEKLFGKYPTYALRVTTQGVQIA